MKKKFRRKEDRRCEDCGMLIYSVKKIRRGKHVYHMTCYKRMLIEEKLICQDIYGVRDEDEKVVLADHADADIIGDVSLRPTY